MDEDTTGSTPFAAVDGRGKQDQILSQAKINEEAFFRTRGGTPRAEGPPATPPSTPSPAPRGGGAGPCSVKKPYNGKFTPGGRTCSAFNVGREHQARELFADGTCKFDHVCDHWVNNKGKAGQCRNSAGTPGHSRATCDNPHGCDNALP